MKKLIFFTFFIIRLIPVYSQTDLPADQIFSMVNNSVVVVLAYDKKDNIYQGSGVVINSSGYIATNYHVCSDANKIEIKHFSQEVKSTEIIFKDENKDILILKVKENLFTPIVIGSSANLKTGQRVYAIGSPEGYENSISEGIISGFRNENNNGLIQMTAPITDGSSGGAVVNSQGELIGLSVSGQHEGNIYFVIPVDDIIKLINPANDVTVNTETDNYLLKGNEAYKKSDYEDAVYYFSKYLEKNIEDHDVYFNRGYSNFKLKKYKPAINDFTKALEFNNENFETFFYRANCYYSIKDYANALVDYNLAINNSPQFAECFYNRGYTYFKLKKYRQAVEDWNKAIEFNPDYEKELTSVMDTAKKKSGAANEKLKNK
ncbi:MAG: tetratricopeptide repeat protein [Ignavibacteriae bacterium]|nr:MAG: tetratricopeptide repeat protein [Ignavibacteriota bacterium]